MFDKTTNIIVNNFQDFIKANISWKTPTLSFFLFSFSVWTLAWKIFLNFILFSNSFTRSFSDFLNYIFLFYLINVDYFFFLFLFIFYYLYFALIFISYKRHHFYYISLLFYNCAFKVLVWACVDDFTKHAN